MKNAFLITLVGVVLLGASSAFGEFDPAGYTPTTQAALAKGPESSIGQKFQVTDPFNFCGSDFCGQVLKTKINTREYYCFTLGSLCLMRMYIKKDRPDAQQLLKLRKGDMVTVYGTFDRMGSNYTYLVVDHYKVEKK